MKSYETRCRHFRSRMDFKTCKIDISFPSLDICYGRESGCDNYSPPTAEENEAKAKQIAQLSTEVNSALEAISKAKVEFGVISCPRCGSDLHWTRSSYNGHVHGACVTKGCVRWMQ